MGWPRALSTHLFANERLTRALLAQIEAAGIPAIEIFCARQHFDYRDDNQVRELAAWFRDHPLELRSLHTPMYSDTEWGRSHASAAVNIAELSTAQRLEAVDEIKRALAVAEHIPFRFAVQHLGVSGETFARKKFDAAYASLEPLQVFARQRGVELLLENIPNELSTPQRLREFLDYTRLGLRLCFDTGHAHLQGGVAAGFEPLRDLVVSTHVHDNHGERDDHLFPFTGTIDWDASLKALATGSHPFPLQFELRHNPDIAQPLDKLADTFKRLDRLAPRS